MAWASQPLHFSQPALYGPGRPGWGQVWHLDTYQYWLTRLAPG